MGINLGGFLSPLVVGTLGQKYNFHFGFGLAAIGMLIGLIVFISTKKKNLSLAGTQIPNPLTIQERKKFLGKIGISAFIIVAIGVILIPTGILTMKLFTMAVSVLRIIIPTCYFYTMYRSPKTSEVERSRLLAYIPLFIAGVMFWSIQEQGSIILARYADERTQLYFAGLEMQSSWFQSLNPIFIVLLAPIFAWLWVKLGNRQPSTSKKFAIGLFFAGISFFIIIVPSYMNGTETLVSPIWIVLSFFFVVIGELC